MQHHPLSKQDEIIRQAYPILYRHGFHATGMDRLLQDSRISKRTLYKHFRSKEALIVATIQHYHQLSLQALEKAAAQHPGHPAEALLALFDLKKQAIESGDYWGCFAINAKLEYEGKHSGIEQACADFLSDLKAFVVGLCRKAGYRHPEDIGTQIMIQLEGVTVYGQVTHDASLATTAKEMVRKLLQDAVLH
ncbi:MAG: TetR/AcrR family transcriptional regulator [Alphaproteobacteria bacterium]|nr:TetR/AcrR family transcriptional regulator [Alphaproteobacteria bacterium]